MPVIAAFILSKHMHISISSCSLLINDLIKLHLFDAVRAVHVCCRSDAYFERCVMSTRARAKNFSLDDHRCVYSVCNNISSICENFF